MRFRWLISAFVALAIAGGIAYAQGTVNTQPYSATDVRVINAGNPQRWDTLTTVPLGHRMSLVSLAVMTHDSGSAAGLRIVFASKNSAKTYLVFHDSLTSGQRKSTFYLGPVAFPKDSTIKVSYYMTVGVVESLFTLPSFRVERY